MHPTRACDFLVPAFPRHLPGALPDQIAPRRGLCGAVVAPGVSRLRECLVLCCAGITCTVRALLARSFCRCRSCRACFACFTKACLWSAACSAHAS
jgi:hypothetical protein